MLYEKTFKKSNPITQVSEPLNNLLHSKLDTENIFFFFDYDIKELLHLYYIITLLSSLKGIDIIKSSDIDVTIKNNFMKT